MKKTKVLILLIVIFSLVSIVVAPKDSKNIKLSMGEIIPDEIDDVDDQTGYYIIQLDVINDSNRATLVKLGVVLENYIPQDSYVAHYDGDLRDIQNLDFVNYIEDFKPEYKIDPELEERGFSLFSVEKVNLSIEVFKEVKNVMKNIEDLGGSVIGNGSDSIIVEIDEKRVDDIAEIRDVEWIEKQPVYTIFNERAREPMGVTPVTLNLMNLSGAGQIVAVADSGLDTGINDSNIHRDFLGRVINITNFAGTNASDDVSGHGTHVAGSVLGNGSKSEGNYSGIAPNASLVFQAIGDNDNANSVFPPSDLNDLFSPPKDDHSATIHTNSWGASGNSYNSDSQETDEFMYNNTNNLVIFSAGNSGPNANTVAPPATAKNVISVGASENNRTGKTGNTGCGTVNADNVDEMACFSSRGPAADGRVKPDVVAPGTFVLSAKSTLLGTNPLSWGAFDSFYSFSSGTSMSAPLVAGMVALVREHYIQNWSITPSAALLKATMINGAEDIGFGMPSNETGWGRVNLTASVNPPNPIFINFSDNTSGIAATGSFNISYHLGSSDFFQATLVWTDYPSTPSADANLVNDLDLIIYSPNGTRYNGNHFNEPFNGTRDSVNNVEQIIINSTEVGVYNITVNATSITQGSTQPFALVVRGAISSVPNLTFIAPTPSNDSITANTFFVVNVSSTLNLTNAILEFNNTKNISMNGSDTYFFFNITSNSSNITYKVYGNNSNNVGETGIRTIMLNNSRPRIDPFNPTNFTPKMEENASLGFNVTPNDTDSDNLGVTWYLDGANFSSENNITFSTNFSSAGIVNITVNVSDGNLNNVSTWNLTVINVNRPPNVTEFAPSNLTPTINESLNQTFNVTVEDADNDSINFRWTLDGAEVSTSDNYTFVGNNSSNGTYVLSVEVNDSAINRNKTWNLTVDNVNVSPILGTISDITVNESDLVDINGSGELIASDLDGGPLNFTFTSPVNSSGLWQTGYQDSGNQTVLVTVSDGILNDSQNVTITILDVEDADNDGLNNSDDQLEGNASSITTSTLNVGVSVNGIANVNNVSLNGTKNVSIKNNGSIVVNFIFNFSNATLNLTAVTVDESTNNTFGGLILRGFENLNLSKTVFLTNNSNETFICVDDSNIDDFSNISLGCNETDEFLFDCNGAGSSGYNCSINGTRYEISGLNNSGLKQQCGDSDGDGYGTGCVAGSDCDDSDDTKNTDCSTSTSTSPGGGGGGGGGSVSPKPLAKPIISTEESEEDSETESDEDTNEDSSESSSESSEQGNQEVAVEEETAGVIEPKIIEDEHEEKFTFISYVIPILVIILSLGASIGLAHRSDLYQMWEKYKSNKLIDKKLTGKPMQPKNEIKFNKRIMRAKSKN